MGVHFTALAILEMNAAVDFYEFEYSGLGEKFKQDVKEAVLRISLYPEAWSVEKGTIRKCLLHTFPYKLLYSIEEKQIIIIAVAHQHRKPDYWVERMSDHTE
jgi:hypothetical protein